MCCLLSSGQPIQITTFSEMVKEYFLYSETSREIGTNDERDISEREFDGLRMISAVGANPFTNT